VGLWPCGVTESPNEKLYRIVLRALLLGSQLEGNLKLLRKHGSQVLCEGKEVINRNCSLLERRKKGGEA